MAGWQAVPYRMDEMSLEELLEQVPSSLFAGFDDLPSPCDVGRVPLKSSTADWVPSSPSAPVPSVAEMHDRSPPSSPSATAEECLLPNPDARKRKVTEAAGRSAGGPPTSRRRSVSKRPRTAVTTSTSTTMKGSGVGDDSGCCTSHGVYLYTPMPEKSTDKEIKYVWVVFYCRRRHSADGASLHLVPVTPGRTTQSIPAALPLSWSTSGEGMAVVQHKWCFPCPSSTFKRQIFQASLRFSPGMGNAAGDLLEMVLGPLSFVSTTSQRHSFWARLEKSYPTTASRHLVANSRNHHSSKRHFLNGKGSTQHSRKDSRFLLEEFEKAIEVPTEHLPAQEKPPRGLC